MSFKNDIKHWVRDLFRYPKYQDQDASYDEYWAHRDMAAPLNVFQQSRVHLVTQSLKAGDTVLDVGCGDGRIAAEIMRHSGVMVTGLDSSPRALAYATERGLKTVQADIRDPQTLGQVGQYDWILLLEVLEHMPDSEQLLAWAYEHARKGIIFSVPNTGFIMHRLRLLFGRFPLQWKAHPSEHLRFWTVRDMRTWLGSLGYQYQLRTYEGLPVLGRIWPAIFSQGLIITIERLSV